MYRVVVTQQGKCAALNWAVYMNCSVYAGACAAVQIQTSALIYVDGSCCSVARSHWGSALVSECSASINLFLCHMNEHVHCTCHIFELLYNLVFPNFKWSNLWNPVTEVHLPLFIPMIYWSWSFNGSVNDLSYKPLMSRNPLCLCFSSDKQIVTALATRWVQISCSLSIWLRFGLCFNSCFIYHHFNWALYFFLWLLAQH